MNSVNLVTALFNIKRDGMDGRTWEEYLKWFDVTLKLKSPMTIFVSEDLREFVEERRLHSPTKIITQKVEEIPLYHLKETIDEILTSDYFKQTVKGL
ncbi:MAG: Synechococcus phage Bellamy [Pseudomonadota bacterium]